MHGCKKKSSTCTFHVDDCWSLEEYSLCLATCKIFSDCKGKGKYFQMLGCILKIALENIFKCFVAF